MANPDAGGSLAVAEASRPFTRNPFLTIVHCGDDEVVVKHGSRSKFSKNIRDEGRTKLLGRILRLVGAPVSLEELTRQGLVRESELGDLAKLVAYLRQEGILIDPAEDLRRVYLETIFGGGAPLAARSVAVVGAGYLGSRIAQQLARVGVGQLIAHDRREIGEPSIDRLYFNLVPESLRAGRPYVECLGEHLAGLGFDGFEAVVASLTDEAALRSTMEQADFVIAALEVFSAHTLHLVNSVAIELGKPWISVYVDGSEALVGPIYVPGESCCYNEFEIQQEATLGAMKDDYLVFKEALNGHEVNGSHYALPPFLDAASGIAATGILRFLVSGKSHLVGRTNRVDFERLSVDFEDVLKLPRCPACSSGRPGYRNLFM